MKTKSILLSFAILMTFVFSVHTAFCCDEEKISVIDLKAMIEKGEKMNLVDVRTIGEYNDGHILGAKHFSIEQISLMYSMEDFPYKGKVILYSADDIKSLNAVKMLQKKESDDILREVKGTSVDFFAQRLNVSRMCDFLYLEGGLRSWIENGGKVEKVPRQ